MSAIEEKHGGSVGELFEGRNTRKMRNLLAGGETGGTPVLPFMVEGAS